MSVVKATNDYWENPHALKEEEGVTTYFPIKCTPRTHLMTSSLP